MVRADAVKLLLFFFTHFIKGGILEMNNNTIDNKKMKTMQTVSLTLDQFICVIPKCSLTGDLHTQQIEIRKLCFWYDRNIQHPVNELTVKLFLKHVSLFGAFINPKQPDKGCWALDKEQKPNNDQLRVGQIYYQGELIHNG